MLSIIDRVNIGGGVKETLRRASGGIRVVDALAKRQVRTQYRLNLSRNIKLLEDSQKVPK